MATDLVRLLHEADGQLGLAVYRGEHDDRWKAEATALIGRIRAAVANMAQRDPPTPAVTGALPKPEPVPSEQVPGLFAPPTDLIARAVAELDAAHYDDHDLKGWGGCVICWPKDGGWPCTTRMIADDLRRAL